MDPKGYLRYHTTLNCITLSINEETFEPSMTVSLVGRRHGIAPNQLFPWRRLVSQGG
jgi:hypothetical protein